MGEYNAVTRSAAPPKSVRSKNAVTRSPVTPAQMAAQRKQMNAASAKVRQNPSPRQQINFTPVPKAGQGQTLREQTIRQAASKRKAPTKPNTAGRGPSNRGNTGK